MSYYFSGFRPPQATEVRSKVYLLRFSGLEFAEGRVPEQRYLLVVTEFLK